MRTLTLFVLYYGCAFYGLVNPFFAMLFFIHITIFRPEALVWGNLSFGRLHFITSLIVLFSSIIHRKYIREVNIKHHQNKNILAFLCFVIWLLVVTVFAEASIRSSFDKTVEVIKILISCFLFAQLVSTENQIKLYVWVISISFGMLSFWGFLQGIAGNSRLDTLSPGGSNYIATQLAMVAPLVVAKSFDTTLATKYKLLFFGCALSIILCCIYTNSRGGFLGLTVGLLVFILQIKQRVKVLAAFVVIVTLVSPWVPDRYSSRISSIFAEKEDRDTSAESRFVIWRMAFRIWQDHPIAGVGLLNFSPVKETYADKVGDIMTSQEMFELIFDQDRRPHGLYPGMMAETGLVGISLFFILLLRNIFCRFPSSTVNSKSQRNLYFQAKGAQSGLIGFTVAALFGDFQYIETLYWQIFFIGAVRSYADSLTRSGDAERDEGTVSLEWPKLDCRAVVGARSMAKAARSRRQLNLSSGQ